MCTYMCASTQSAQWCREALKALAGAGPLIEVGAGTGYWAMQLRWAGVQVTAVDSHPPGPDSGNLWHKSIPAMTAVGSYPSKLDKALVHDVCSACFLMADAAPLDVVLRCSTRECSMVQKLGCRTETSQISFMKGFCPLQVSRGSVERVAASSPSHALLLCYPPSDSTMASECLQAFRCSNCILQQ